MEDTYVIYYRPDKCYCGSDGYEAESDEITYYNSENEALEAIKAFEFQYTPIGCLEEFEIHKVHSEVTQKKQIKIVLEENERY